MDGLGFNKIAAAVLATALGIVGLRELSSAVYAFHPTEKPGYMIEVAEEAEAGGAAAEVPPDWGTVLPVADIKAGEAVHQKCLSCHNFDPGGANGTGPGLYDLVNRKPGTHGGFAYSGSMVAYGAANPVWTYEKLDAFIKSPGKDIPGTKMTFVGVKKQQDRINLIAYLRTLAPAPAAIPAPNPAAATAAAPAADGAAVPASATPAATPDAATASGSVDPAAQASSTATLKPDAQTQGSQGHGGQNQ